MNVPTILLNVKAAAAEPSRGYAIALIWTVIALIIAVMLVPGGRRITRQIFAVAVLGFREGLRQKVLWTVFLLSLIPGTLSYLSDADGTHTGRAALIVSTCFSSGEILGACLIVLMSALSVAREIESRIMHTFGVKPVPRWAILAGKAMGFWAIDLLFIAGLTLFTFVLVRAVPSRPEVRPSTHLASTGNWSDLQRNILTTWKFQMSEDFKEGQNNYRMVKPGDSKTWRFAVDPDEHVGQPVVLRFMLSSTVTFASQIDKVGMKIGYAGDEKPIIQRVETVPQDRPFDLFVDPQELTKPGTLEVTITASKEGRYPASIVGYVKQGSAEDSFAGNLFKAFLLLALQGWILATITTSWSGVLSFPVTVALGAILVLGGEMSRQALDILQSGAGRAQQLGIDDGSIQKSVTAHLQLLLSLLPDFRGAGAPSAFVEGQFLSGWAIAQAAMMMGVVRGLAWCVPGIYLFHQREVGK
jgi:hypothetical protein